MSPRQFIEVTFYETHDHGSIPGKGGIPLLAIKSIFWGPRRY
jgi:hypothetical protein